MCICVVHRREERLKSLVGKRDYYEENDSLGERREEIGRGWGVGKTALVRQLVPNKTNLWEGWFNSFQ